MAQPKVTEFFSNRKRRADSHPAKRLKLTEPSQLVKLDNAEVYTHNEQSTTNSKQEPSVTSKKATRSSVTTKQRQSSRKSVRAKSKQLPQDSKQPSISESFLQSRNKPLKEVLPSDSSDLKVPTQTSFDFNLTTVLPSDCDAVVTEYAHLDSPHGTPTKRHNSSKASKTIQMKRKRKTEPTTREITPSTATREITPSTATREITPSTATREITPSTATREITPSTATREITPSTSDFPVKEQTSTSQHENSSLPVPAGSVRKKLQMPVDTKTMSASTSNTTAQPIQSSSEKSITDQNEDVQGETEPSISVTKPPSGKTKLSPAELKSMLAKCGKLENLKACLQKVNSITKEVKEKKVTKKKEEKAQSVEVSNKSQVTPAYVKYKDLAVKIPPTLTLPYKYKLLEDMFRGADTVISIMHNRLERVTFNKLKQAVQDMIRRNFDPKHLGQIKAVYPESYDLRQEKGLASVGKRSSKYQLAIEANLNDTEENMKTVSKRKDGRPVFSSSQVLKRKEIFRGRLFDIVKSHHQRFLEALNPPLKVDKNSVTRWHPKFLLDNIPEVEAADLPPPPEEVKELITAKDVLNQARGKLPTKVEQALQKVAEASEAANNKLKQMNVSSKPGESQSVKPGDKKTTVTKPSASSVSSSLLERIRAKEALKQQADMVRDEDLDKQLQMLDRLPEMIKILRSYFITERKAALTEENVRVKLCDSYKSSISHSVVEKHVDYMLEILPEWITRVTVTSGKFIKINRQTELSTLYTKVNKLHKEKQYVIPGQ